MDKFDFEIARKYITHSITRARQRYVLFLNENHICEIADLILSGKGELKSVTSKTRSVYKVRFQNKNLVVVFDKVQMLPVTLLPHKVLATYNQKRAA